MRLMSLTGRPTDWSTITMVTKPALGILAAPIDATVAVKLSKNKKLKSNCNRKKDNRWGYKNNHLIIMYSTKVSDLSFNWAMKMGATASYRAVPSILIVLPTGSTNRVTRESIFKFSSKHRNVTGRVADDEDVPNPVITAFQ